MGPECSDVRLTAARLRAISESARRDPWMSPRAAAGVRIGVSGVAGGLETASVGPGECPCSNLHAAAFCELEFPGLWTGNEGLSGSERTLVAERGNEGCHVGKWERVEEAVCVGPARKSIFGPFDAHGVCAFFVRAFNDHYADTRPN